MYLEIWNALQCSAQKILQSYEKPSLKKTKLNHIGTPEGRIILDYSDQQLDENTFSLLVELAQEIKLTDKVNALMNGDIVNKSQNRSALHTALRLPDLSEQIIVRGKNVLPDIVGTRERIYEISEKLRASKWLGYSGEPISDIVNIGIGGSDLGPKFCYHALQDYATKTLRFHFISDCDPYSFNIVENLNPQTTLFIVSSKSFITIETLYNLEKALRWIGKTNVSQHFIAVTANLNKAKSCGIKHILPIWEWVGGRYSATSAINLITAVAIGSENFNQFLMGAHEVDMHFLQRSYHENLPIIYSLLGVWNTSFLDIRHLAILLYSNRLEHFIPFVQQVDMESNGKSIDQNGNLVSYATCPIVWGGIGNRAQHSYYQLMCQGTHPLTADFVTVETNEKDLIHKQFVAKRKKLTEMVYTEGYNHIPLNHISLKDHTPKTIGALIALSEHKAFVQGMVWNLNPFDQPGVEHSKMKQYLQT